MLTDKIVVQGKMAPQSFVAKWMEKNFGVMLSVNGGMLWLTFFIFRVIMFPYILFMLFKDFYEISQNDPRYAQVWTFEMVYHPCTILFLWVISVWAVAIWDQAAWTGSCIALHRIRVSFVAKVQL